MKAKFIRVIKSNNLFDKHAWEHTDLLYEYRGYEYIVTQHNNGYAFDSIYMQHKNAQRDIDERIEATKHKSQEWKYEGSAQEGFDLFWDYINS